MSVDNGLNWREEALEEEVAEAGRVVARLQERLNECKQKVEDLEYEIVDLVNR